MVWVLSGFADEVDPDPDVAFGLLERLGLRWVELRSAWGVNVLDLDAAHLRRLGELLRAHGLRVSSVGSPIGKIGVHEPLGPELERMRHACDLADRFAAPYLRIFSFFMPPAEDPDDLREPVLDRMSAVVDVATGYDVTVVHENEKAIFGDVPRRCIDLAVTLRERFGSHAFALLLDPANYVQCGIRPVTDGYDALAPFTAYLHVKDARLADGGVTPAGEGDGELPQLVRRLAADGYDGFASLEPHLGSGDAYGGFSGVEPWRRAHAAFTDLLRGQGVGFR